MMKTLFQYDYYTIPKTPNTSEDTKNVTENNAEKKLNDSNLLFIKIDSEIDDNKILLENKNKYLDMLEEQQLLHQTKIKILLQQSDIILDKLNEYTEDLPIIDFSTKHDVQTFYNTRTCKTHILREEDEEIMYAIMCDLSNAETLKHVMKKRPTILNQLRLDLEKAINNLDFNSNFIKALPVSILKRSIIESLAIRLRNRISKDEFLDKIYNDILSFDLTNVSISLGQTIMSSFFNYHLFYKESILVKKAEQLNIDVYESKKTSDIQIKDLIKYFLSTNFKDLNVEHYNKTFSYVISTEEDFIVIKQYLRAYAFDLQVTNETDDFNNFNNNIHKKQEHLLELTKLHAKIGVEILDILVKEKFLVKEYNNDNIPQISINGTIMDVIYTNASHYKPWISKKEHKPYAVHNVADNICFNIRLNNNLDFSKNTHRLIKDKLKILQREYNQIPMEISGKAFKDFLAYYETILAIPFDPRNKDILGFLKSIYFIDFEPLVLNNSDYHLVLDIMRYGLDLTNGYNKNLHKRVRVNNIDKSKKTHNVACLMAFNTITAYLYNFKGILNDLNIYAKFNHFYIPKTIKSSGRFFSKPHFIQLQNLKFLKGFILFKSQKSLEESSFEKLKASMIKHLPDMDIAIKELTFHNYQKTVLNYYDHYINTMLLPKTDILSYFSEDISSYKDQLNWVVKYCKKPKNIWLLLLLLQKRRSNDFSGVPFEMDATQSGSQVIAILMRDSILAKKVNLIGFEKTDLYSIPKDFFAETVNQIVNKFTLFFKENYNMSLENAIAIDNTIHIDNSSPYNIKTWLYNFLQQPILPENLVDQLKNIRKNHNSLYKEITGFINNSMKITDSIKTLFRHPKVKYGCSENSKQLQTIYRMYNFVKLYHKIPKEIFDSRELFKLHVMIIAYNGGTKAFKKRFKNYFEEQYAVLGLDKYDSEVIDKIIDELLVFFDVIKKMHFTTLTEFSNICAEFIKENDKNTEIDLGYIKWILRKFIQDEIRIPITTGKSSHNLTVHLSSKTRDVISETSAFASIFVHSIDSYLIYLTIEKIININYETDYDDLFKIYYYFNHDCYTINMPACIFLVSIVQHSYNQISDLSKKIPPLHEKVKTKQKIKCVNPNFIKH